MCDASASPEKSAPMLQWWSWGQLAQGGAPHVAKLAAVVCVQGGDGRMGGVCARPCRCSPAALPTTLLVACITVPRARFSVDVLARRDGLAIGAACVHGCVGVGLCAHGFGWCAHTPWQLVTRAAGRCAVMTAATPTRAGLARCPCRHFNKPMPFSKQKRLERNGAFATSARHMGLLVSAPTSVIQMPCMDALNPAPVGLGVVKSCATRACVCGWGVGVCV